MTSPILPEFRKKPKQERGRQAVAAIEQACLKILEKEGPRHLTSNRIAEVAGVCIGSLYHFFPNKESIVAAVYAAKLSAETEAVYLGAHIIAKAAKRSLENGLRALIQDYVNVRRRLLQLDPEFYGRHYAILDPLTAANRWASAHKQMPFEQWFPAVLRRHRARLRVADLQLASALTIRTIEGPSASRWKSARPCWRASRFRRNFWPWSSDLSKPATTDSGWFTPKSPLRSEHARWVRRGDQQSRRRIAQSN